MDELTFYKPEGMSRRDFVRNLTQWGAALGLPPAVIQAVCGIPPSANAEQNDDIDVEITDVEEGVVSEAVEARQRAIKLGNRVAVARRHYRTLQNKAIRCFICARNCYLPEGKTCFCYTHKNHGGKLYSYAWNNPCVVRPDPVEKGPMFHFRPGSFVLSVATAGCMLRCLYCQNWELSQQFPERARSFQLDKIEMMKRIHKWGKVDTICYTYTEPIAFYEWMTEIGKHAHAHRLRNIMVTSGFIREMALRETFSFIDAYTITLKGFTKEFYEKVCAAKPKPVMNAMETVKSEGKWLEVPILLVPNFNDDMKTVREMCKWIYKTLGKDTPVHFAKFVPRYKMRNLPETPLKTLVNARKVGMDVGLEYVYIANFPGHEGENTYCPKCKRVIVRRIGLRMRECKIRRGRCMYCGHKIPGIWA